MEKFKFEDKLKELSKEITYITEKGILFNKSVESFEDPYIETQVFLSFDDIIKMADLIKEYREHNIENIK